MIPLVFINNKTILTNRFLYESYCSVHNGADKLS